MTVIEEKEKTVMSFQQTQYEKKFYLGEFKENVILALNKKDISLDVEEEFLKGMKRKDAVLLKISRDVELKNVKGYIEYAEEIKLNYRLVDDISFEGEVGMVIVADEALDNKGKEVILETEREKYIKKGLSPYYADCEGEKICKNHYKELKKSKMGTESKFGKMNFFDKFIGRVCPICVKEKKKEGEV